MIDGVNTSAFNNPANNKPNIINKPKGSIFESMRENLFGNSPDNTLPPSKGGTGNKFKTINIKLIKIPAILMYTKNMAYWPS